MSFGNVGCRAMSGLRCRPAPLKPTSKAINSIFQFADLLPTNSTYYPGVAFDNAAGVDGFAMGASAVQRGSETVISPNSVIA